MVKQINAVVLEAKMNKTVTVNVLRSVVHPKYKKILWRKTRYKVHNDGLDVKPGDSVVIEQTKPYSKDVNFKLSKNLSTVSVVSDVKPKSTRKAKKI